MNNYENYGKFDCMRMFNGDKVLPLSVLELLPFALLQGENEAHRSDVLVGDHEHLPCFPLKLISELAKFEDFKALKNH